MKFQGINIKTEDVELLLENKKLKEQNAKAGDFMEEIYLRGSSVSPNTVEKFQTCASFMGFLHGIEQYPESASFGEEKKVMVHGFFCGNRFCPICSKNKARKDAIRLSTMVKSLETIEEQRKANKVMPVCYNTLYNQRFIFVTLTVPNCKGSELYDVLTNMNNAFNRLIKLKLFDGKFNGYVKKVEVTYNSNKRSKSFDTYHPHFHILFAVDKDYFTNPRKYISHSKWLDKWKQVTKDPTISQVNVKSVPNGRAEESIMELSKYIAKDSDYLYSADVFQTFYNSLKGRRMMTYGGVFGDLLKEYENGTLDEFTINSYIDVLAYYSSLWDKKKDDYENYRQEIADLKDFEIDFIVRQLKKRGYEFIVDSSQQKAFIVYVGRTTYGEEEKDD